MSDWIEHDGMPLDLPYPIKAHVKLRDGTIKTVIVDGPSPTPDGVIGRGMNTARSVWRWALQKHYPWYYAASDKDVIAYRLHDDGQSEAETRKARMDQFYKIAAGKEHLIEETMKPKEKAK